jgi:general stress protein 26
MEREYKDILQKMFNQQYYSILATAGGGQVHTNIVAFFTDESLKHVLFITPRNSRKYKNIKENNSVSLFIDDRANQAGDIMNCTGVTVYGIAVEIEADHDVSLISGYCNKHTELQDFLHSKDTAIMKVNVSGYSIVNRFQNVTRIEIEGSYS